MSKPTPPERRLTIAEFVAQFRYEKELRQLLVEAESDRQFYAWFLSRSARHVDVVPQQYVLDDHDLRERLGLTGGVKNKLLAAAAALTEAGAPVRACVAVDRDTDGLGGIATTHALVTDYSSLEMYAYAPSVLDTVLGRLFARGHVVEGAELLGIVEPVLIWVAACRRMLSEQAKGLVEDWLTLVDVRTVPLTWKGDALVGRSPGRPKSEQIAEVRARVDALAEELPDRGVDVIRGHDFADVLLKLLQSRRARDRRISLPGRERERLEGLLRVALERDDLLQHKFFQDLIARWSDQP